MKLVALDEIMNLREPFALREIAFNLVRIPEHADNSHTPAVGDALELCLEYGVSDDHMEMPVCLPSNHPHILFGISCWGVIRPSFLMRRFEKLRILARRACRWLLIQRGVLCRRCAIDLLCELVHGFL